MAKKVIRQQPIAEAYDKTYQIKPLKLFIVIVNRYQGDYYMQAFKQVGVSASFITYAKGTATNDIYKLLGVSENHRDIVMSLVKDSDMTKVKKICQERFNLSKNASGIAFSIKLDSMIGVLLYKFFTDTKQNRRK